jgi:succinate dehydrogenase / fumarate reductase cytochrome b subunit
MSLVTETVRHPKGPAEAETHSDAGAFLRAVVDSSVGAKVLVALTGLGLVTFVVFHLIGNLKLFQGPEAINHYAYFLKHDLGVLIWIARGGLLAIFVLHLWLAIRLKLRAKAARPIPYAHSALAQAGLASRSMIWTGIVIGLFTLFHLAHFTFGWISGVELRDPNTGQLVWTNYLNLKDTHDPLRQNVYEMMIAGFSNGPLAALYIVAQLFLYGHLRHGIPSMFQTLGLKNARFRRPLDWLGLLLALAILIGNCAIVVAVQAGSVKSELTQ